jgi:hypothetical protein
MPATGLQQEGQVQGLLSGQACQQTQQDKVQTLLLVRSLQYQA